MQSVALLVGAGLWFAVAAAAEEAPGAAQDPAAQDPAAQQFARIVPEKAQLRCWPSAVAAPPVFEDTLAQGDVVEVGRVESGFRAVILPLGPLGYVSKKFTTVAESGEVVTKGADVSFRFRPRSSEAPVTTLPDATPLAIVGEDGDWWRARVAGVQAWLPEAELELLSTVDEAARAAIEKVRAANAAQVQARKDEIARHKQLALQNEADLAAAQQIEKAFADELRKPADEQRFDALEAALKKLDETLSAESAARAAIAALRGRIETQKWIAEAVAVQKAEPVPATDIQPVVQPKDELERFQAIGFLRYQSRLGAPGTYYIEKGGRRLHVVACSTGRYDLALFLDREIGVMGPRRRAAQDGSSQLDIERIEVLGLPVR